MLVTTGMARCGGSRGARSRWSTRAAAAQCQALMDRHHVYLLVNGRISMAGLNTHNVDYVAAAIHDVVTTVKN